MDRADQAAGPLRHSFMKALRSSPFKVLALGSALHFFILSCCVILTGAGGAAERHSFMNFWRSSPFKVLAFSSALQLFILFCWGVGAVGALSCACATPRQRQAPTAKTERSFFMIGFPR